MRNDIDHRRQSLAQFREFMGLEKHRASGLSLAQFERWVVLKSSLERAFGSGCVPSGKRQRATPRVPVAIRVSFDGIGAIQSLLMTNLSRGGIFVPIERPPEIGTELELRIKVADPRTEIRVTGVVVSRNLGPDLCSDQKGMGIRFTEVSDDARKLIDDLYESEAERLLESQSSEARA